MSAVEGLLKLKSGLASITAELQLNARAWTREPYSVIHKHVVSTAENEILARVSTWEFSDHNLREILIFHNFSKN